MSELPKWTQEQGKSGVSIVCGLERIAVVYNPRYANLIALARDMEEVLRGIDQQLKRLPGLWMIEEFDAARALLRRLEP
jgi:hypothetical protein